VKRTNWIHVSVKKGISLLVLLSLLLLVGCRSTPRSKGEVIVYVAAPLSGWQADGGQTVVGGVRLMAERINAAGGLLAAMDVYKDLPLVIVTPTASDVSITQKGYRNFFRVNATDAAQAPVDARFLVEKLGAKRIAVVHANNEYGRGLRDQMVIALKGLGVEPAAVIEIPEAASSQAKAVQQIQALQPDAIFLAGYETEGYILLPELREAGITVPFMASDGCFLYEFIDGSGAAAEGAYVSGITPDPKLVADKKWWADYQQLETRNPGTYSVAGYSAMDVIAAGVKKANTFDASKVADAIRSLDLQTLVGQVRYNSAGDLQQQPIYIFHVENGEFVQLSAE
jgi:branched-chain amino acid transport system substrate-binding protein